MYQITCSDGYELHVIGKGDNGLCRVVNRNGQIVLEAGYVECAQWLADRGVKQHVR